MAAESDRSPELLRRIDEAWKDDPARLVSELVSVYEAATSQKRAAWKRWRKMYRHEWYLAVDTSILPSTNFVHSNVEMLLGYYLSQPPTIDLKPEELDPDVDEAALTQLLTAVLDAAHFNDVAYPEAARLALLLGTAWWKVRFDARKGPYGAVAIDTLPPEAVMADPWAPNWDSVRFVLHRIPMAEFEVKELFGSRADIELMPRSDRATRKVDPIPRANVIEAWLKTAGKDGPEWQVAWVSGKHVLRGPEPSPYAGDVPFIPVWDIPPVEGVLGVGEAELIEPLQDYHDELTDRIRNIVKKTENRIFLVNEALAGFSASDFVEEGGIVPVAGPNAIQVLDVPPFPQQLLDERQDVERRIQTVTGVSPLLGSSDAAYTGSTRSGVALSLAAEAQQRRVESRLSAMRRAVAEVARKALRLVVLFYREERIIRTSQHRTVHIWPDYPESLKQAWAQLTKDERAAQKLAWRQEHGVDLVMSDVHPGLYSIAVETDSAQPSSKSQKANLALALYKERAIDQEALLEAMEWPGRDEIIERMQGQQQAAPQAAPRPSRQTGGGQKGAPATLQALLQGAAAPGIQPPVQPALPQGGGP
ncbi:MAG: hypothetical protein QJR08_04300 [Bacillota bacterium]|nr:hypothetical protein [Bacillota bacterium]